MKKIIEKRVPVTLCENPVPIVESEIPVTTKEDYLGRIESLWAMPQAQEYNVIVVYGDREHFSNILYFTGYDPRFEEALLILKRGEKPVILVGNEGMGYVPKIPYDIKAVLFQTFGLMGQPNEDSEPLEDIFRREIGGTNGKIGLAGWKFYRDDLFNLEGCVTDVPHYITETLRIAADGREICNAVDLLMDNEYGLRHHASAKEIIQFELQGTKISRGVYRALKNMKEGMSEIEVSRLLEIDGEPECTHPNVNFGDAHAALGLNSPEYHSRLAYGSPAGAGYGMRGSLVHKMGMFIRTTEDLPECRRHYVEELAKPYFSSVAGWYEMMKPGTEFGEIYDMVEKELGFEKYNIVLNPGHLIHTDEWTNSPFVKGSKVKVRSGMVLQCDYTVCFKDPYLPCHIEDGLAIGNEALHNEIKEMSPSCYERIKARRKFMTEVLGINLPEEVLPLSDLPAVCFPYMADTSVVLAVEK